MDMDCFEKCSTKSLSISSESKSLFVQSASPNTPASASGFLKNKTELVIQNELIDPENVSTKSMMPVPLNLKKKPSSNDMKSGYYILDTNETMKKGIPKYIYLGPEAPNVIYNSIDSQQMDE